MVEGDKAECGGCQREDGEREREGGDQEKARVFSRLGTGVRVGGDGHGWWDGRMTGWR
jgi:hypothetical protein